LKIAFISGPANAPEIYREWAEAAKQVYFGTDYLKQYLQVASDLDAKSYVVTWNGHEPGETTLGAFTFDNRPITTATGFRYYLQHLLWHVRLLPALIRFRPDVLMLTGNQNFWWTLAPVRWLGAKIVVSYHAVLWPQFRPVKRSWRFLLELNRIFILRHAEAILSTSRDIRRQIEQLLGRDRDRVQILDHLPTYAPEQFAGITPPNGAPRRPFRTFFMSRIEENKGIFDVVEVAQTLEKERPGEFRFDICGSGGALPALQRRISDLGLEDVIRCHGFSSPEAVTQLMSASHACIVPTRSDYEAGFEMTCSEAILAGRPLVTSAVCPAIDYLRDASVEAEPDNAGSYRDAIVRLSDDPELYARKQSACATLQGQFYDRGNSWYAAMRRALDPIATAR
jgi:glycosyltransferase involved in cell wall biosynthesis